MSYILEALKKAQAERQLGAAPTIHAATLAGAAGAQRGGAWKKPLLIAVPVMGAAIVVLLGLLWKQSQTPPDDAMPPAPSAAPAPQLAVAPMPPQQQAPLPPASQGLPQSARQLPPQEAGKRLPPRQDKPAEPPPVRTVAKAKAKAEAEAAAAAAAPAGAAPPAARVSADAPAAKPAASDESVTQTLRDLPEPIQRAIPAITMGGYIYSKNPADRLLVIDKVLRREGEELAPGFVLEKLQPREAIFNYKGYRYRVPY